MSYCDNLAKCGGLWLRKYLLDAAPNDATSSVCVHYAKVVKHIAGPRADGSVIKRITDGDIYLNAVFTAEAIKEGVHCDDSQADWSQASVLLKVYHLRFQTEDREIVLFVTKFALEVILDKSSISRLSPMSYLQCPEIRRKYENHCHHLWLTDDGTVSDCSLPVSLLLTQMSAEGENQTRSVASRVHSDCIISDPNHMRPLDLDHFLIGPEDQIKLQSIEDWLSDFVPPSVTDSFPSVCSSVAVSTCDAVQTVPPSGVKFCSVGIQVSLDHHPARPSVAEVGVAVGNSLLFYNSQECRFPPRTDIVTVHREAFSSSGSAICFDEALEALAQPVLSSESSENMRMEPVSQIPENSVEPDLSLSSLHNGHFEVANNISGFVEPVRLPKMNADQTIAHTKNDMQSDQPYQSTQIDYLSSQHVLMEPCFALSPLPFSGKKKSPCPADSLPIINSETLSDGRILSVPLRESANQNSEKSIHENTATNQNCRFRSDCSSENIEKTSANAKKNGLDIQACTEIEPAGKEHDNGRLVVNKNFTAASESLSLRNRGTENQKRVFLVKPPSFKFRHMQSSLAPSLNQGVPHLEPLNGSSWFEVLSQNAKDGIVLSGKCAELKDPIPRSNQHEDRENVSSGSKTLVCERQEIPQCRSSMLLSENEDSNARHLDPLSAVSSNSLVSMPSSSSCVGQNNRFGGLPLDRFGEKISNSGALTSVTYCNRTTSSQQLVASNNNSSQSRMSGSCASVTANDGVLTSDSSVKLISSVHLYRSLAEKLKDSEMDPYDEFLLSSAEASKKKLGLSVANKNVAGGADRQEEFVCLSGDEEQESGPAPKHLKIDGKGKKEKMLKVKGGLLRSESKNPEALFGRIGNGKVVGGRKRKLFTGDRVLDESVEKSTQRGVLNGGKVSTAPKDVASLDKLQRLEVETTMPEASSVRVNIGAGIPTGGKLTSNQCPASKDVESYRTETCTENVTVATKLGKKMKRTLKENEITSKTLETNSVKHRVGGLTEKQNDAKKSYEKADNAPSTSNFMSRVERNYNPNKYRPQNLLNLNTNASDSVDVEPSTSTTRVLKINRDLSLKTSRHCPTNQTLSKPLNSKYHVLSSSGAADLIEQEKSLHDQLHKSTVVASGDHYGEVLWNQSVPCLSNASVVSSQGTKSSNELQRFGSGRLTLPTPKNSFPSHQPPIRRGGEQLSLDHGTQSSGLSMDRLKSRSVNEGKSKEYLVNLARSGIDLGLIHIVLLGRDQMTAEQAGLMSHSNFPDNLKWRAYNYCKNLSSVSKHSDC